MICIKIEDPTRESVRVLRGYKKYKKLYILKSTNTYAVSRHYPIKNAKSFLSVEGCYIFRTLKTLVSALHTAQDRGMYI